MKVARVTRTEVPLTEVYTDVSGVENVNIEVQQQPAGKVLYVCIDGVTVLRVSRLKAEQITYFCEPLEKALDSTTAREG